ncbi:MAG: YcgL domain-containing protein [Thiothrix sp.]|nr:MAG: YcgL domain-containing protein [Thiothrix sp.]
MKCFVYRSSRKPGAFLFVAERGEFSELPEALLKLFGTPEFSFEFPLTADRALKIGDAQEILEEIEKQGYFLQLPVEQEETGRR